MTEKRSLSSNLKRMVAINSKPNAETFPELPNILIWVRFVLAIAYGTYLGVYNKSRTWAGLMMGLNFITFLPILYCSTFLGADNESYGAKVIFGGVLQSVSLMFLIWIYFYTKAHEADELKLGELLAVMNTAAGDGATEDGTTGGSMESEF
jgi:hypothetical protein